MTELTLTPITIPSSVINEENPFPVFRNPEINQDVPFHDSIPPEKRELAGWETGERILPYRMQDQYTRHLQPVIYNAVVLENEILKATFLPEMGGRLISLLHKPDQRELLSRNPVLQLANLATRNAWFSGGIEWNVSQLGHTFTTCSPVFAGEIIGTEGEPGLRIYEFERCKKLVWQIDFYLPSQSPFLIAYYRVINPYMEETSMYWWTNVAVPELPDVRVLAPEQKVIYIDFSQAEHQFGWGEMPFLSSTDGKDASYSNNFTFASEYFFQLDNTQLPWEAALDGSGSGFIEASTPRLRYRKMFCWGQHPGGQRWQNFLSLPGHNYLEIQAGLAPTQLHGLQMPGNTQWDWLQIFGYFQGDPRQIHDPDYSLACRYVDQTLKQHITADEMQRMENGCRRMSDQSPVRILAEGSGWGALENRLRDYNHINSLPSALPFLSSTLSDEQSKWIMLLENNVFPEPDSKQDPGEWMVQKEWFQLLSEQKHKHWFSLLHEGNYFMENLDIKAAINAWRESNRLNPSPWATRNLAIAARRENDPQTVLNNYQKAWSLACNFESPPVALVIEYLQVLVEQGEYKMGQDLLDNLPDQIHDSDRVQILSGRIALELGDFDSLSKIFDREYAVIREGETELTDLWNEMQVRKLAKEKNRPIDDALLAEAFRRYPPPTEIDFRMSIDK